MSDDREQDEARRRATIWMIGAAFVIVIIGGWLMFAIHSYLARERCWLEGHRYCDGPPIEIPQQ